MLSGKLNEDTLRLMKMCLNIVKYTQRTICEISEKWRVGMAEKIEVATTSGNSQILSKSMRGTGGQRISVNEVVR